MIHARMAAPSLSKPAFDMLASFARAQWGLVLAPNKRGMVATRLKGRVRAAGLNSFDAYARLICSDSGAQERPYMISALTTNVSAFFREAHHFDYLARTCLPQARAAQKAGRSIRIWSAGCSNGQEPYSIAIALLRADPSLAHADLRVLGTDLDPKVISFAQRGIYPNAMLSGLTDQDRARFFDPVDATCSRVKPVLRRLVQCRELNLLDPWPISKRFHAVFCRNVAIYFDMETQAALWPRFEAVLNPGGLLCLGHAERLPDAMRARFDTLGPTVFARRAGASHPAHAPRHVAGTAL